jgi:hypothetical protein
MFFFDPPGPSDEEKVQQKRMFICKLILLTENLLGERLAALERLVEDNLQGMRTVGEEICKAQARVFGGKENITQAFKDRCSLLKLRFRGYRPGELQQKDIPEWKIRAERQNGGERRKSVGQKRRASEDLSPPRAQPRRGSLQHKNRQQHKSTSQPIKKPPIKNSERAVVNFQPKKARIAVRDEQIEEETEPVQSDRENTMHTLSAMTHTKPTIPPLPRNPNLVDSHYQTHNYWNQGKQGGYTTVTSHSSQRDQVDSDTKFTQGSHREKLKGYGSEYRVEECHSRKSEGTDSLHRLQEARLKRLKELESIGPDNLVERFAAFSLSGTATQTTKTGGDKPVSNHEFDVNGFKSGMKSIIEEKEPESFINLDRSVTGKSFIDLARSDTGKSLLEGNLRMDQARNTNNDDPPLTGGFPSISPTSVEKRILREKLTIFKENINSKTDKELFEVSEDKSTSSALKCDKSHSPNPSPSPKQPLAQKKTNISPPPAAARKSPIKVTQQAKSRSKEPQKTIKENHTQAPPSSGRYSERFEKQRNSFKTKENENKLNKTTALNKKEPSQVSSKTLAKSENTKTTAALLKQGKGLKHNLNANIGMDDKTMDSEMYEKCLEGLTSYKKVTQTMESANELSSLQGLVKKGMGGKENERSELLIHDDQPPSFHESNHEFESAQDNYDSINHHKQEEKRNFNKPVESKINYFAENHDEEAGFGDRPRKFTSAAVNDILKKFGAGDNLKAILEDMNHVLSSK